MHVPIASVQVCSPLLSTLTQYSLVCTKGKHLCAACTAEQLLDMQLNILQTTAAHLCRSGTQC